MYNKMLLELLSKLHSLTKINELHHLSRYVIISLKNENCICVYYLVYMYMYIEVNYKSLWHSVYIHVCVLTMYVFC